MHPHANGSTLADPTPMLVQIAGSKPGVPPLQLQVWADWRGAPNDGAALTSVLVLGMLAAHQTIATLANRIAALEVATVETDRLHRYADLEEGPMLPDADVDKMTARRSLALAAIASVADQIEISGAPVAPADDTVGAPASALDLLGVDAPAPGASAGPTDDGAD